ncbi:MAG TPA: transposase [Nevskiales bacterium]|nr:transposase [Nevskiales bacterium]
MARLPRIDLPGVPQHIIQRGNNRGPCFFAEDDYRYYLECLREAAQRYDCSVHAYVLMTNHVHLLATAHHAGGLPRLMQSVGRRYVRYVNSCYRRTGTLWEGRYRACLIDSERYLLACYRYIELNPVRAGIVADPARYPWSSYGWHALGKPDKVIVDHPLYLGMGATAEERCVAYRRLFQVEIGPDELQALREATIRNRVWGGERFKDQVEAALKRRVRPGKMGRPRKSGEVESVL